MRNILLSKYRHFKTAQAIINPIYFAPKRTLSDNNNVQYYKYLDRLSLISFKSKDVSNYNLPFDQLSHLLKNLDSLRYQLEELHQLKRENEIDQEIQSMALQDICNVTSNIYSLYDEILEIIWQSREKENIGEVQLEVGAGVGGQEAMLFAGELFDMYCNYAHRIGWRTELEEVGDSNLGGVRFASMLVRGNDVYRQLQFEGGIHRVQRVPRTERGGRIHTSTASVAVLPVPAKISININSNDLHIETKRASGAGGQHVNTTDSAVRIIHLPSGLVAQCQQSRFQYENKAIAIRRIHSQLYERQLEQQMNSILASRKLQIGSRARAEKIRTYNIPQDRVTDHRIGKSFHNVSDIMCGGNTLTNLMQQLQIEANAEHLSAILENIS